MHLHVNAEDLIQHFNDSDAALMLLVDTPDMDDFGVARIWKVGTWKNEGTPLVFHAAALTRLTISL